MVRSRGFSERFVETERSLLPGKAKDELDVEERLAVLRCLCGRIIRGERCCRQDLFTSTGSLWVNNLRDTDKVPPGTKDEMRLCLAEKFQTFALLPCRLGHQTLALFHVCDKRRGLLSEQVMARLEKAGKYFAELVFQLRELKRMNSMSRGGETKQLQVLVVDDEVGMASTVTNMLEAKGYQVITAFSAPEALNIVSDQKVDLVVTDLDMPIMSGLGLAGEIKKRWHPYSPPVILMSGTFPEEVALRKKGPPHVAALLTKPFSISTLVDTVHRVLS